MQQVEIIVGLLTIMGVLGALAQRMRIALPVLLAVGGMIISLFVPYRTIRLEPDTVFFLFLPPLLYAASFNTPWRELHDVFDWVCLQAIGLVLLTVLGVSAAIHAVVPGISWPMAFVFGAIVSPTDAVAAAAISKEVALPRKVMAIVNGESLVNDATGLVCYKFALAAAVTGTFAWHTASHTFFTVSVGGILLGGVLGWILSVIRIRLDHRPVEIISSLITPFFVYLIAEHLHLSSVLAVVTAGLIVGFYLPRMYSSLTRFQARATWETISYALDGLSFLLMGLQFSHVVSAVKTYPISSLILWTFIAAVAPTLIRLLWAFSSAPVYAKIVGKPRPPWSDLLLFSWSGMRGVVSLAAALALPLVAADGTPLPYRDLVVYLTVVVIVSTLVIQGLTLPFLAKKLATASDAQQAEESERRARLILSREAVRRVDEVARQRKIDPDDPVLQETLDRHLQQALLSVASTEEDAARDNLRSTLEREAISSQRSVLISLRNKNEIDGNTFDKLQRELDIEEIRLSGVG